MPQTIKRPTSLGQLQVRDRKKKQVYQLSNSINMPWVDESEHHAPEMRRSWQEPRTLEYLVAAGANCQDVRAGLLLKKCPGTFQRQKA